MSPGIQKIILQGVINITVAEVSTSEHHATDLVGKNIAAYMKQIYTAMKEIAEDSERKPEPDQ